MSKERLTLIFTPESYDKPITYRLITEYSLQINILKAEITPGKKGHLLIDLEGSSEALASAKQFLQTEGIYAIPTAGQISVAKEQCVHCGACTAVCFSQAMIMDRTNWQVSFLPEYCIACGLCVNACPLRLISGGFGTAAE